jgi:hypothetical protein
MVERASGCTLTAPAKGWLTAVIVRPETMRKDRVPVTATWARRFSVPKNNVKPIVRIAPLDSTSWSTLGVVPEAGILGITLAF